MVDGSGGFILCSPSTVASRAVERVYFPQSAWSDDYGSGCEEPIRGSRANRLAQLNRWEWDPGAGEEAKDDVPI